MEGLYKKVHVRRRRENVYLSAKRDLDDLKAVKSPIRSSVKLQPQSPLMRHSIDYYTSIELPTDFRFNDHPFKLGNSSVKVQPTFYLKYFYFSTQG